MMSKSTHDRTCAICSGAKVIKLFSPVIFGFLYKASVLVRLDWRKLNNNKHYLITKICKLRAKNIL